MSWTWLPALLGRICAGAVVMAGGGAALAAPSYDAGASDTTIRIGNTAIYSGPGSTYGTAARAAGACFAQINAQGGLNGRKIEFISVDDGYSPPRTVEQTRRLVEHEQVLFIGFPFGTSTSLSVRAYLNQRKVPQLFVASGATEWEKPAEFPWSMGFAPSYVSEAAIYGKYILAGNPQAKIAILQQNDEYGRDFLRGLRQGLGEMADKAIVRIATYETTDSTVSSQIGQLKASGADTLLIAGIGKFAAQALKSAADQGWKPLRIVSNNAIGRSTLEAAGLDVSKDVVSTTFLKDPTDPQWAEDAEVRDWLAWRETYFPQGDKSDVFNVYGTVVCNLIAQIVRQAGNELTRANIMRQALSLKDVRAPMLAPGIVVNTSPTDNRPIKCLQPIRFDGDRWQHAGELICLGDKPGQ